MSTIDHMPRSPAFWRQLRAVVTDLGAFLRDHASNQFRMVTVKGMLAGHFTYIAVFDRSTDGGVDCTVSIEVSEDEWVRLLSIEPLTTLDTLLDAAEDGAA